MTSGFCEGIIARVPAIITRWETLADCEPWRRLTESQRRDYLPQFVDDLFKWTICDAPAGDAHPFLEAAAKHGYDRRLLGLSFDVVMQDSVMLRRAIWDCAQDLPDATDYILSVDAALSVGLMASLRGYGRPELHASGKWEDTLATLAEEWSSTLAAASKRR